MTDRHFSTFRVVGASLFLIVLAAGWRYPILAYCMFLNVAVGIYGAFKHGGRHACGNVCPRGAFYSFLPDTGRGIPRLVINCGLGILIMPLLLAGLIIMIRPGASFTGWGRVFYGLIAATTAIGVIGGLIFNRFFWCSMCPMGKIYAKIGQNRGIRIHVSEFCVHCGSCAKACPFQFRPDSALNGVFTEARCIKCGRCVKACPRHALSLR